MSKKPVLASQALVLTQGGVIEEKENKSRKNCAERGKRSWVACIFQRTRKVSADNMNHDWNPS